MYALQSGFKDHERPRVAALYWQAFRGKLGMVMGPDDKALAFLTAVINPGCAIVARDETGQIDGVAGFKTSEGALVGGGLRDLAHAYGWPSTLWRAPVLGLVERDLAPDVLLMDGICVAAEARGQGLGTRLLAAIKGRAKVLGLSSVRLDVIDTNPRARALYEREGFAASGTETLGPLRWVFKFNTSTRMVCMV